MADNRNREWWHRSWTCDICRVTIRRHHRSRHLQGKGHIARAKVIPSYEELPSDILFSTFLHNFDTRILRGYEKKLLAYYRDRVGE